MIVGSSLIVCLDSVWKMWLALWDTAAAAIASTRAIASFHGRVFSFTRATWMLSSCRSYVWRSSLRTTYGSPPWSRRGENCLASATGIKGALRASPGYATGPGDSGLRDWGAAVRG